MSSWADWSMGREVLRLELAIAEQAERNEFGALSGEAILDVRDVLQVLHGLKFLARQFGAYERGCIAPMSDGQVCGAAIPGYGKDEVQAPYLPEYAARCLPLCPRHCDRYIDRMTEHIEERLRNQGPLSSIWKAARAAESEEDHMRVREVRPPERYAKSTAVRGRRMHLLLTVREHDHRNSHGDWVTRERVAVFECGGAVGEYVTSDTLPKDYDLCHRCVVAEQLRHNRDEFGAAYGREGETDLPSGEFVRVV